MKGRSCDNDIFMLLKKLSDSTGLEHKLFLTCGTEDFLYEDNKKYRDYMAEIGVELRLKDGPAGHKWKYWDTNIKRVLDGLSSEIGKVIV